MIRMICHNTTRCTKKKIRQMWAAMYSEIWADVWCANLTIAPVAR